LAFDVIEAEEIELDVAEDELVLGFGWPVP
jgi:hypothetical protein